ncbi:MAG: DUF86 domain-containing protein [bacterium]|nr:DUF86 domain-containing protein [bacterium]
MKSDRVYLHHILDMIERVESATRAAFRNVLVHDYLGIDLELVWTVVTRDVPAFKAEVTRIIGSIE